MITVPYLRSVTRTRPYIAYHSRSPRPMTFWHTARSLVPSCMQRQVYAHVVHESTARPCSLKSARKALVPGHHGANSRTYTFRARKQPPCGPLFAYHSRAKDAPAGCLHGSIQDTREQARSLTCPCDSRWGVPRWRQCDPPTYLPPTYHLPTTYLPPTYHLHAVLPCARTASGRCGADLPRGAPPRRPLGPSPAPHLAPKRPPSACPMKMFTSVRKENSTIDDSKVKFVYYVHIIMIGSKSRQ